MPGHGPEPDPEHCADPRRSFRGEESEPAHLHASEGVALPTTAQVAEETQKHREAADRQEDRKGPIQAADTIQLIQTNVRSQVRAEQRRRSRLGPQLRFPITREVLLFPFSSDLEEHLREHERHGSPNR